MQTASATGRMEARSTKSGGSDDSVTVNTASVTKRLQQELTSLMCSQDGDVSAFPSAESLFSWVGTIGGPSGTAYEGLTFRLSLAFTSEYPFKAPTVRFETPCFHPNVDMHGNICLDILKEKWSAAYSVRTILHSIQSLLNDANCDSPLNAHAAKLWEAGNVAEYKQMVLRTYEMKKST